MASIDNTTGTEVTTGALPDSVDVAVRPAPLSTLRLWEPTAGLASSGWDVGLYLDPADDDDALTLAVLDTGVPNGLSRTTENSRTVLWAEPSPRSWDLWSAVSQDLSIAAPTGVTDDEYALGVGTEIELTTDDRIVPKVVRPVILLNGCFQDWMPTAEEQPKSTMYGEVTLTHTPGDTGVPVVDASEIDFFYGAGGSCTYNLPAVTVDSSEGTTYKIRCDLRLRYRDDVAEVFDVSINALQVGLQVIEYTSL